jgi:hypothetical protein
MKKTVPKEIASYVKESLSSFLACSSNVWDWDDFVSTPISDHYYESIRKICLYLPVRFPPEPGSGNYCNTQGYKILSIILSEML